MFMRNKKIIDERQELQSLKNIKISWTVMILLLAFSTCIQSIIFNTSPMHFMPELIILLVGCFLNLILEIRQGNLYTKEMQNTKRNLILYTVSALVTGLIIGIGNYMKYDFPPIYILVIVIPMFLFTLALMLLCDFLYRKLAQHKLNKINKTLEDTEKL